MAWYNWSRTPASNATADASINMAEGMAPSQVNDGIRALMARTAEYRDDISGAIATGGTSTAYTVTSYSVFSSLSVMANQMIAFTPHTTNAATVTLNVDGLGAKPLRTAPSTELLAGVLIQGTPYVATYNNSDAAWYLQGFYGQPYSIPLGGIIDFTGSTAPNSSFVLPYGQAISRTTYAAYFVMVGSTYGIGDGSTTFNVPDLRGRVVPGADNMGGSSSGRLSGGPLAGAGGAQSATIAQNQLPNVTLSYSNSISVTSTASNVVQGSVINVNNGGGALFTALSSGAGASTLTSTGTSSGNTSSINGGVTQNTLSIVPPFIALNKILRII